MKLLIDGVEYSVGAASIARTYDFKPKYDLTAESGRRRREIRGIYPTYTLSLGNIDRAEYDRLMSALLSYKEVHEVKLPDSEYGDHTFQAMYDKISDELVRVRHGVRHWDNLSISFTSAEPLPEDRK